MIESKKVDLSWITQSESAPTTEVEMAGMTYQVPLSSEMDLITSLKDFNGALRTWPKKKLESRWEIFESIRESFRADRDHIARIMKAERGEKLGLREHKELFDVLEHWRLEDLKSPGGSQLPLGLCAVLLDERHPWISWLNYAVRALLHGSVVAVRFLPENILTATYLQEKLKDWDLAQGRLKIFCGAGESWDSMACSHPATTLVVVECAGWEREFYKKLLGTTWKRFALLSPTRTVALLLEEASAEKAEQIVERTLSPAFGFEQLGRLFTLDRHFDGWKQELEKALNSYQGPRAAPGRKLQQAQWEEQQNQIRKEKNIEQHPAGALYAFDFSNCAPIHQQVLLGPFLSLTRSKYVHEAIKFAQTTPLKVHATLLGPPEKMDTWSEQLGFQHVWCNRWPQWSWQKILNPGFSLENYFLGAGSVPELFYQRQQRIYPA